MKRLGLICLFVFAAAIFVNGQTAAVIAENANLRGTASGTGMVVVVLPSNSTVEVVKQQGPWFLVQASEFVGWMHGDTLRMISRATVNSQPTVVRSANTPAYVTPTVVETTAQPSRTSAPTPTAIITVDETRPVESESANGAAEPTGSPTGKCTDGTVTYAENRQDACSNHGGVDEWFADSETADSSTTSTSTSAPTSSGGSVRVKGYYRKDGTYVRPHTRSAPRRRP